MLNDSEIDAETGNTVRIGSQGERASMFHQHFANKDEADTLLIPFPVSPISNIKGAVHRIVLAVVGEELEHILIHFLFTAKH